MSTHNEFKDKREPVVLAQRLVETESFNLLFAEGMDLIEETASYLDKTGREEQDGLSGGGSLAYDSQAMGLTCRLMQMASWLLLQRAVNERQISREKGTREKAKLRLYAAPPAMPEPLWRELPERLKMLVKRSLRLEERIKCLDKAMQGQALTAPQGAQASAADLSEPTALSRRIAALEASLLAQRAHERSRN